MPQEIRPYYAVRGDLSVTDGKIIYQNRLVIPPVLQSEVLERIHDGHQGITKCRERANMSVWWPGIGRDILNKVSMCDFCQENLPEKGTTYYYASPRKSVEEDWYRLVRTQREAVPSGY